MTARKNRKDRANTSEQAQQPQAPRDAQGRWLSGVSPNPTGRPAVAAEVREAAQRHGLAAITALAELMQHPDAMVKLQACKALLDRGYGRPELSVSVGVSLPPLPTEITNAVDAAQAYERLLGDISIDIGSIRFGAAPLPALEHIAAPAEEPTP